MSTRNDETHQRNMLLLETWRAGLEADKTTPMGARARRRGERALDTLLRDNTKLVWHWANKTKWPGVGIDELHAAGMTGLLRGIEKYDESHGCTLATYATWWIRQAIGREAERWHKNSNRALIEQLDENLAQSVEHLVEIDMETEIIEGMDTFETTLNLQKSIEELAEIERDVVKAFIQAEGNLLEAARILDMPGRNARHKLHVAWSKLQHPSSPCSTLANWEDALCKNEERSSYFPPPGRGERVYSCANCPKKSKCLETALKDPKLSGIWGGTSEHERKSMRKNFEETPSEEWVAVGGLYNK